MDRGQSAAVVRDVNPAAAGGGKEEEVVDAGDMEGREDGGRDVREEIVLARPPGEDDVVYPSQVGS
jgi:pre-mRNA-splicing factor RBM22/SLT11